MTLFFKQSLRFKTIGFINLLLIKVHVQVLDYEILL